MNLLSGFFDSWADSDVRTFVTRNSARNEDHVILSTHLNHFEVLNSATVATVTTRHLLVLPNTARPCSCTNTTRTTVHHVTVRVWLTGKVVTLNNTLEALTLGCANDINPLTVFENSRARVIFFVLHLARVATRLLNHR